MNPDANKLYQLNDDREKVLWDDCIFVFDSSALLDFYTVTKNARDNIYKNILTSHKGRFWIPAQVQYEFLKNREKVITKPITEQYEPLKNSLLKEIDKTVKQIENHAVDLQNRIKDQGKHPHFDSVEIDLFKEKINEFKAALDTMSKGVNSHIDNAVKEIMELSSSDDVLLAFQNTLNVGRDYSFEEIYKITQEGRHRFEYAIPPGYKDLEDDEKKGTQIFGDLIIWKQLLEYAKGTENPIIFICDDLKEDWCYIEKRSGNEKRIIMPREELIKEMYDLTGSEFWMYNLAQFLYMANKYWGATINEADIKNVAEAIATRKQNPPVIEFDLMYESGGRSPMGYSARNPVEVETDGRRIMNIGGGIKPIIHWHLDWRWELRIFNNSSFPAFNLKIESIGEVHFTNLEKLPVINNVKPLEYIALHARFDQEIESVHTDADELMKYKIPLALEGLLLRVLYFDESRNQYVSHMKIEGNRIINI